MSKTQEFIRLVQYHNIRANTAMSLLDFFAKHDGFNGWILEDDSKIDFIDNVFVEKK